KPPIYSFTHPHALILSSTLFVCDSTPGLRFPRRATASVAVVVAGIASLYEALFLEIALKLSLVEHISGCHGRGFRLQIELADADRFGRPNCR
ncbi:hypothetical protein B296_00057123, partial [Ensete ventricosum]